MPSLRMMNCPCVSVHYSCVARGGIGSGVRGLRAGGGKQGGCDGGGAMNPLRKPRKPLRLTLVVATLLLAAGAGYDIKISPPLYLESATVEFSPPKVPNAANAYYVFAPSLITSGEAMVQILMSPSVQNQIGAVGRGASVSLALVNLYNEEYPNYGVPLATLTAASPVAADTHRTFVVAARTLGLLLAARQEQAGVRPSDRISARILGDSGPIIQTGSRARVYGGLALLAAMAIGLAGDGAGRRARKPGRSPQLRDYDG